MEGMSQSESQIQTDVLKFLKGEGVFCWRQNNHATFDQHTGQYRAHAGLKGVPDIIAIIGQTIGGQTIGQFVGFEVKTPKGKLSADQVLFKKRTLRHGGAYFVVRSVSDAREALASLR